MSGTSQQGPPKAVGAERERAQAAPLPGRRFPRGAHLLKHADFERVYKKGQRHFSGHVTAFYLRRGDGARGPRIGFTVGRVLGGAVERNRIRRRMREAVRLHLSELTAAVDVVFNPKKSVLKADFKELQNEVGQAFGTIQTRSSR